MRFDHIKARSIGPFKAVDINLGAIPGLLVAVTGENGAGKSTLMELLAGAMFRKTPTRGSLVDLATGRDSFLEVSMANGQPYTIRHTLDCISKKSEAVVMDGAGAALTEAGKVRSVDSWVEQHMPTPEVLYTSTFSPQGSGGFMELSPADRKRVLLRVLGVERLEGLAQEARKQADEWTAKVKLSRARLDDERGRTPDLASAVEWLGACRGDLRLAASELEGAEKAARDAERAAEAAERAAAERRSLVERMGQLDVEALSVERRHDEAQRLAGRADEVRVAREQLSAVEGSLATVRADLAQAREWLAAERQKADEYARASEALRSILDRAKRLGEARGGHERDMAQADQVEAAEAALPDLEAALEAARAHTVRCESAVADLRELFATTRGAAGEAETGLRAARERLTKLEVVLAREVHVREQALRREALAGAVVQAEAARSVAELNLGELQSSFLASKDTRIAGLRQGLDDIIEAVSDGITRPADEARRALEIDDARSAEADAAPAAIVAAQDCLQRAVARKDTLIMEHGALHDVPRQQAEINAAQAEMPSAQDAVQKWEARHRGETVAMVDIQRNGEIARGKADESRAALDEATRRAAAAREVAGRAAVIARAQAALAASKEEQARLEQEARQAGERIEASFADVPAREDTVSAITVTAASLERQAEGYRGVLADADAIAAAGAEVEAAQRDRLRIETALAELRGQLAALPDVPAVDMYLAQAAAQQATVAHQAAQRDLITAEQQVEQALAGAERIAALEATLAKDLDEVSDWTRLGRDLGRDGIQALEIDAAGPELTSIANDLLHTCVSRRWTMEVRTQRASADGKRQIEGCDVVVIDTERGREGEAETFSGGERVLLGEALSLALSVLACRRHGVVGPTLVRDESGAALDASNGRAYIAMLRRAALLIGASQCLFVSHSAELQELADARIHVADGCATVIGGAS